MTYCASAVKYICFDGYVNLSSSYAHLFLLFLLKQEKGTNDFWSLICPLTRLKTSFPTRSCISWRPLGAVSSLVFRRLFEKEQLNSIPTRLTFLAATAAALSPLNFFPLLFFHSCCLSCTIVIW